MGIQIVSIPDFNRLVTTFSVYQSFLTSAKLLQFNKLNKIRAIVHYFSNPFDYLNLSLISKRINKFPKFPGLYFARLLILHVMLINVKSLCVNFTTVWRGLFTYYHFCDCLTFWKRISVFVRQVVVLLYNVTKNVCRNLWDIGFGKVVLFSVASNSWQSERTVILEEVYWKSIFIE